MRSAQIGGTVADHPETTALRLAEAATEGPWRAGAVDTWHVFAPNRGPDAMGPERVLLRMNEHFPYMADAAHIAHAHPGRVRAWLGAVARLRERAAEGHSEECMATAPGGMPCDCGHEDDLAALAAVDAEG